MNHIFIQLHYCISTSQLKDKLVFVEYNNRDRFRCLSINNTVALTLVEIDLHKYIVKYCFRSNEITEAKGL